MNFDRSSILALKEQLEETGYSNDEQGHHLGSFVFEHRRNEILDDLQAVGYHKPLEHAGGFFPNVGGLYWFYDPEIITKSEAKVLSEEWDQAALEKRCDQ